MKKTGLLLLILFLFQISVAQELTLKKGAVIDSIAVSDTIAESYSLYLPNGYAPNTAWPVIFVFDPEGRGRTAAQLFRKAGEEQGYVIVSSNDIDKRESLLENTRVATRLLNTVLNMFLIDTNQIYMAGLGDGGRVASVMPAVYSRVQGVLAVSDTWLNTDFIEKGARYSFVGLAGYNDYRLRLLDQTADYLRKQGMPARTYNYNGGQEWPEFEMISNALGTFTLEAMDKGFRQKDPGMVEELYAAELETAERLRRTRQDYKAHELLSKMLDKYARYGKKQELEQRIKDLSRTKIFRDQRRQYNRAAATEDEYREQYLYFFNEDVFRANFENLGWWNQQIKELEELQQGNNPAEAEMAHRVQGLLRTLATNSFKDLKERNATNDQLVFTAILQTIFDKENPEGYLNIISISAGDGDYYTALLYLEDLLKTGYDDLEALYNIPRTLDLKLSPEFNKIIEEYLGESKYYKI
ncbi:hypothetical protein FHG64_04905 [Antarcticibacterium flavum]|uniref:Alpha/beta hydrolase n=1 Tax=Antarcticibacterium flavum TaxID=2058175 RepID=A0A5B7X2B9_9FLAO|nr:MULTISPECIES: hypothetical protein [Antarcticibacterium]MCM4160735.1 hypothetical protein [Antarcticibacterium sp. W02-3]QCY68788.1 hypothetical protein FHG64_04905 [Antarcticibacterium flavum]